MAAWAGLGYYARARNLHRLRASGGGARRAAFPTAKTELRSAAGASAPIPPPRSPRSPSASARWWSTAMSSGWSRGCFAIDEPLPRREAAIRAAGRCDHAGRARRRFRPGDDGPRRDDLHPARSAMPAVPASGALSRASKPAIRRALRSRRRRRPRRSASAPPSGSSATARSGSSAARQAACSAECARCPTTAGRRARMARLNLR